MVTVEVQLPESAGFAKLNWQSCLMLHGFNVACRDAPRQVEMAMPGDSLSISRRLSACGGFRATAACCE